MAYFGSASVRSGSCWPRICTCTTFLPSRGTPPGGVRRGIHQSLSSRRFFLR
jgi:hypothetical protein